MIFHMENYLTYLTPFNTLSFHAFGVDSFCRPEDSVHSVPEVRTRTSLKDSSSRVACWHRISLTQCVVSRLWLRRRPTSEIGANGLWDQLNHHEQSPQLWLPTRLAANRWHHRLGKGGMSGSPSLEPLQFWFDWMIRSQLEGPQSHVKCCHLLPHLPTKPNAPNDS